VGRPARALIVLLVGAAAACQGREPALPAARADPAGAMLAAADRRPPWQQIDRSSLAACGACHLEVYAEWERSLHHYAWTNTNVREETQEFTQAGCRPCHSPQPVLGSGLDRRPEFRDFNQDEGVHCLSCHGLEDGVAAARTIADAPCRPRYSAAFLGANLCWPCHEPTHHAFEEYERSDAKAIGLRCADCHMPPRLRPESDHRSERTGVDHGPNGGLNPDWVKRAIAWSCVREGGEVVVTLRNRTGHKFPGEIPSRVFQVKVVVDDGEPTFTTLRKPAKTETRADDRLDVDETRVLRYPVDAAARAVAVKLLFKPFPLLPEEQAFVLGAWSSAAGDVPAR
jgi:hypothetical protein